MELVITEIQGSVDGPEGLEVNINFLLFSLIGDDGATVDDKAVWWDCKGIENRLLDFTKTVLSEHSGPSDHRCSVFT